MPDEIDTLTTRECQWCEEDDPWKGWCPDCKEN